MHGDRKFSARHARSGVIDDANTNIVVNASPQNTASFEANSPAITIGRSSEGIGNDSKTLRGIRTVSSDIKERYENQVAVIRCRTKRRDCVDQWEDDYRSQETSVLR
jgi:hypothetical protein